MKLLPLSIVCLLLGILPSGWSQLCPCEDTPPNDRFTCAEQKGYGQCNSDWMTGFCLCTCGTCKIDIGSSPQFVEESRLPPKPELQPTSFDADETQIEDERPANLGNKTEKLPSLTSFQNDDSTCFDSMLRAISGSRELVTLHTAVVNVGLEAAFADWTVRSTLFAPTNGAFEKSQELLGLTVPALLNDTSVLSILLQYHLIPGSKLTTTDLLQSENLKTALKGYELIGGSSDDIKGVGSVGRFVGEPIQICRSIVYLIDTILLPETSLQKLRESKTTQPTAISQVEQRRCQEGFSAYLAISLDNDLTLFAELLESVGISGPLRREVNPFTVFAPINEAFNSTLETLNMNLESLQSDKKLLENILRYHIIKDKNLEESSLKTEKIKTIGGSAISLEVNNGVELSGKGSKATVIQTDVDFSCKSAVHKINNVLLPFATATENASSTTKRKPSARKAKKKADKSEKVSKEKTSCQIGNQNLFQVLSRNQNLRVWTRMIRLSGLQDYFADETTSVTMFAPNDAAFGALLSPGSGFGELVPDARIARILVSYHTVFGAAGVLQIKRNQDVGTFLAGTNKQPVELRIKENPSIPSGLMIKGLQSTANVVEVNIIGCNSVIHILDAVLLPYKDIFPSDTVSLDEALENAEDYSTLIRDGNIKEEKEDTSVQDKERTQNKRGERKQKDRS